MATLIDDSWTQLVSYASTYSGYTITYKLYAMYTAESIANNTHTISLKWTTTKASGGTGVYDGNSCTPSVTNISGGNPSSWTGSAFTIPTGSTAETTRAETTGIVVTHATDGTYSATWSWSLSHVYAGGSKSGTVAVTLPTIARASSIALSSHSILTNGTTTATITGSTAFTHNITTTYGGTSYTLASGVKISSGSSVTTSLSIPTGLRGKMKTNNASSVALTLTLTTLSGSTSIGTATTSLTISVPTATVTVTPASVSCDSTTSWTLGNVDTSACTYTVQRLYGSTVRYTDETKATTTTKSNLANTLFEANITSATSGTVTVKVTTYVGTTTVGTNSVNYTVTIPTGTYKPGVSFDSATRTGSTYGNLAYLAGHNGAKLTFTSSVTGSSAINSRTVSVANNIVNASLSYSGNTITVTTGTLPANSANYTVSITVTVTDRRGTSASATTSLSVSGYTYPTFTNYSATRANSGGTVDSEGKYANITATGKAGKNATLGNNAVQLFYTGSSAIAQGNPTASITKYGGNFDLTKSYSFTAKVTDTFGFSTSITLTLPSASYILSLHPDGGVGMGMVASAGRVDIAYQNTYIHADDGSQSAIRVTNSSYSVGLSTGAHQYGNRGVYDFGTGTWFVYRNADNDTVINSNNYVRLSSSTLAEGGFVLNNGTQYPMIGFRPSFISDSSPTVQVGRIYFNAGSSTGLTTPRFFFRVYSADSTDTTKVVNHFADFQLPTVEQDKTSDNYYAILTTKNVVTEAQGGTGQSDLNDVTVGTASRLNVVNTQPTSATNYYINFDTATGGNLPIRANAGFIYRMLQGTTSTEGYNGLLLGRNIAKGSANSGYGFIRLFGHGTHYYNIYPNETANTANITLYMPNKNGTIALEPVELYANGNGTTDTVTLSETSANFAYLDIYYYSVPTQSTSTKRYGHTRVAYANGKTVTLTNALYWSNYLEITNRTIVINGTSITNASNEQAQFRFTNGSSPTRSSTSSLIYIIRVEGIR